MAASSSAPSLGRRLLFSFVALLLSLVLIEVGLQVAALVVRPWAGRQLGGADAGWRVMGVGDSWMAGAEAPEGAAFIEVLGRRVEADHGVSVAISNYGVGGTNSAQALLAAEEHLAAVQPQVLLLLSGANDPTNSAHQAAVDERLSIDGARGADPWGRLRTVKLLRILRANLAGPPPSAAPDDAATAPGPPAYDDPLSQSPWAVHFLERSFEAGLAAVEGSDDPEAALWAPLFLYGLARDDEATQQALALLEQDRGDGSSWAEHDAGRTLLGLALGLVHFRADRRERASAPLAALHSAQPSWFRDLGLILWALDTNQVGALEALLPRALAHAPDQAELHLALALLAADEVGPELSGLSATLPAAQRDLRVFRAAPAQLNNPPRLAAGEDPEPLGWLVQRGALLDSDRQIDAAEAEAAIDQALTHASDARFPAIDRALALAASIRWGTRHEVDRDAAWSEALETLPDQPQPWLAALARAYENDSDCDERERLTRQLLGAGSGVAGLHPFIAECFGNERLGTWEDEARVHALGPLVRPSHDEVLAAIDAPAPVQASSEWAATLAARLDHILALCEEQGTTMVVLTYPRDPSGRLPENQAIRAWAGRHPQVVLADAWKLFRDELSDAEWAERSTPNLHVDEEGYRMMGELIYRELPPEALP